MPAINIDELVSDLVEYLPPDVNVLTESQLRTIAENVVSNNIPEDDDEAYYSEALCKSLKVAAIRNNSLYIVDGDNITREKVDGVEYYFDTTNKDIWKNFIEDLPNLCPYLPKGGYKMKSNVRIYFHNSEDTTCYTSTLNTQSERLLP